MKRWAIISLTVVAAVSMAGRQQELNPCEAASFNEQACQAAIPSPGYCWNGRYVRLKYHFPYPYYYEAYQEYLAKWGVVNAAAVGSCVPPSRVVFGSHGVAYGGFGATGTCYTRAVECTRQEFGVRPDQSAQHPEIPTTLKAGGPGRSFVELIYYGSGNVFVGQGMQLILRCNEFK